MLKKSNSILGNIFILLKPYKIELLFSIICSIFITIICVLIPSLSQDLIDNGLIHGNCFMVVRLSLIIVVINGISELLTLIQKKVHLNIKDKMQFTLSKDAFKHLTKLKMYYFEKNSSFALITSVNMAIGEMCETANTDFLNVGLELIKMIGGSIGLIVLNLKLAIVVSAFVFIRFLLLKILKRKRSGLFEKIICINMNFSSWYSDVLNGIRTVKLWNLDKVKEFTSLTKEQIDTTKFYERV